MTLTVKKHVINDDGNGLTADKFTLGLTDDGTTTTFPGSETGTTFSLEQGHTYSISEDLGSLAEFYAKSLNGDCNATASCDSETGDGLIRVCTVTNNDLALKNRRSINVTQSPWTYAPKPVGSGSVQSLSGSFSIVNVSNNQPNNVLIANMRVRLEIRRQNKGLFTLLADPASCSFTPAAPFVFSTTQNVTFTCNLAPLGIKARDVLKATVLVNLFQGHTNFTSSYAEQIL